MQGFQFSKYTPKKELANFDALFDLFQELLIRSSGDVREALKWLSELDDLYELTNKDYTLSNFVQDLINQGFITPNGDEDGFRPTAKVNLSIRQRALDDAFRMMLKARPGEHRTNAIGSNTTENTENIKPYEFGDRLDQIALSDSLRNAQVNHGIDDFQLTQQDLEVYETPYQTQTSTVLMIDISHSMILYGEDRITPAKKVAMALSQYITTKFPKDTLDVLVFGNDAWVIQPDEIPYLEVGPYHTNTVAGLELAMDILRKRRNPNRQVFMITDGKPSCIKKGKKYYKSSFGLDQQIVNRTLNVGARMRKANIPITTFMIAQDPYLVTFVDEFTQVNQGKAFYADLEQLGEFVLMDYKNNKRHRR